MLKDGVTLTPREPSALKIVVKDENGNPLQNADVHLTRMFGRSGGYGGQAKSDVSGEVVFKDIYFNGAYAWGVSLEGYDLYNSKFPAPVAGSETWKDVVEVVLRKADMAKGRVVDEQGKPLAGAEVTLHTWSRVETKTDANGEFQVAVPDGDDLGYEWKDGKAVPAPVWFKAVHAGRNLGVFQTIEREALLRDGVTLTLKPATPLTIVVKDPQGKALEGAQVVAGAWFVDHGEGGRILYTNPNGEVVSEEVYEGGNYGIMADLEGYHQCGETRLPKVGSPEWKNRAEVVMEPANRTQKGVVLDPDGKPVAGAVVNASMRNGGTATTDSEGRFELKGLPASVITIYVRQDGLSGRLDVSKDTGEAVIQLRKNE